MKRLLTLRHKEALVRRWLREGLTEAQVLKALDEYERLAAKPVPTGGPSCRLCAALA